MTADVRGAAGTGDETALSLAQMQSTQPWTAPYSEHFETSKRAEPHRSLMHDLMHVTKAVGVLSSIAEWADHGSIRTERVDQAEYEGRIADLVMCALHMANNPPQGYAAFVLHRAVVSRVERVNGVAWEAPVVARDRARQEAALRALHVLVVGEYMSWCAEDQNPWPCETVRILDGETK